MGRGSRNELGTGPGSSRRVKKTPVNPQRERWLEVFRDSEKRGAEREANGLGENIQGVEMMTTDSLLELREYERDLYLEPESYHSDLYESIRENGVGDAVVILYNPETRVAYVGEGNHRILIAHKLGIKEIPARVNVSYSDPNTEDASCLGGLYISGELDTSKELITPTELQTARENF